MTYQDIHGSSATRVAVNFNCSPGNPCSAITVKNIMLTYKNQVAKASCNYASVTSFGIVQPAINCYKARESILYWRLFQFGKRNEIFWYWLIPIYYFKVSTICVCVCEHVYIYTGVAWCIWGPKAKIDYLVLDAKLLLININYVEFFPFFLEIL